MNINLNSLYALTAVITIQLIAPVSMAALVDNVGADSLRSSVGSDDRDAGTSCLRSSVGSDDIEARTPCLHSSLELDNRKNADSTASVSTHTEVGVIDNNTDSENDNNYEQVEMDGHVIYDAPSGKVLFVPSVDANNPHISEEDLLIGVTHEISKVFNTQKAAHNRRRILSELIKATVEIRDNNLSSSRIVVKVPKALLLLKQLQKANGDKLAQLRVQRKIAELSQLVNSTNVRVAGLEERSLGKWVGEFEEQVNSIIGKVDKLEGRL